MIPVIRRLLADGETPVGLYRKLARERAGTFLLESAEHGRVWSRYSFVGVRSRAMLTESGGQARWLGNAAGRAPARPAIRWTRCATPCLRCTRRDCPGCRR